MKVKVNGAPPVKAPTPVAKEEKTPDTAMGKITTGKKRGMGAALRGSRFTIC